MSAPAAKRMKTAPDEAGSSGASSSEVAATLSPSRANRVKVDPDAELAAGIEETAEEEESTEITDQMKAEEEK